MPNQNLEERARPRSVLVREQLTQRIDSGALAAGSRLPSEPALATELGVSRATLREALRALESEGLVRRMWGAGTFVADGRRVTNSLDANFGVTDAIRRAGWACPAASCCSPSGRSTIRTTACRCSRRTSITSLMRSSSPCCGAAQEGGCRDQRCRQIHAP